MNARMADTTLALALALEGTAQPASEEIERLAGIAGTIATLPDPEIDPRFAARLEARLMAEFDAISARPVLRLVETATPEPTPEPALAPNVVALPRRRLVVRKALAAAIAAAMLSALPVVASASSLPGSPFFGIERWRQNQMISSAHGAEKAFAMEHIARRWIGYAEQMTALRYERDAIDGVLGHAGRLQAGAVALIVRLGTDREIARLGAMLESDAARLRELLDVAGDPIRPVLLDMLAAIERLADRLAGAGLGSVAVSPSATAGGGSVEVSPSARTPSVRTPRQPQQPDPGLRFVDEPITPYACQEVLEEQTQALPVPQARLVCTLKAKGIVDE